MTSREYNLFDCVQSTKTSCFLCVAVSCVDHSNMSSVVDPLLSTVSLDLLRPKDSIKSPEELFRKVSFICSL